MPVEAENNADLAIYIIMVTKTIKHKQIKSTRKQVRENIPWSESENEEKQIQEEGLQDKMIKC